LHSAGSNIGITQYRYFRDKDTIFTTTALVIIHFCSRMLRARIIPTAILMGLTHLWATACLSNLRKPDKPEKKASYKLWGTVLQERQDSHYYEFVEVWLEFKVSS